MSVRTVQGVADGNLLRRTFSPSPPSTDFYKAADLAGYLLSLGDYLLSGDGDALAGLSRRLLLRVTPSCYPDVPGMRERNSGTGPRCLARSDGARVETADERYTSPATLENFAAAKWGYVRQEEEEVGEAKTGRVVGPTRPPDRWSIRNLDHGPPRQPGADWLLPPPPGGRSLPGDPGGRARGGEGQASGGLATIRPQRATTPWCVRTTCRRPYVVEIVGVPVLARLFGHEFLGLQTKPSKAQSPAPSQVQGVAAADAEASREDTGQQPDGPRPTQRTVWRAGARHGHCFAALDNVRAAGASANFQLQRRCFGCHCFFVPFLRKLRQRMQWDGCPLSFPALLW